MLASPSFEDTGTCITASCSGFTNVLLMCGDVIVPILFFGIFWMSSYFQSTFFKTINVITFVFRWCVWSSYIRPCVLLFDDFIKLNHTYSYTIDCVVIDSSSVPINKINTSEIIITWSDVYAYFCLFVGFLYNCVFLQVPFPTYRIQWWSDAPVTSSLKVTLQDVLTM